MADLVNMQQTEYDEVLSRIIAIHQEELSGVRDIIKNIRTLCEKEGGFYVNQISEKVNMLLDSVEGQVISELETNFEVSRQAMETFMSAVKEIDSV